ncbi:hypothetical protein [Streptomyces niveus]|uniref:hypothetical protein n=1 Tax=Streptomyces niveus TaxID=193462 RepID=UPI003435F2D3
MRMDWPEVPDWMPDCADCCAMYRGVVAAYELPNLCFTIDTPLTELRSGLFARHVVQAHPEGVTAVPHQGCWRCEWYAIDDDSPALRFLRAEHQARALFLPPDVEINGQL